MFLHVYNTDLVKLFSNLLQTIIMYIFSSSKYLSEWIISVFQLHMYLSCGRSESVPSEKDVLHPWAMSVSILFYFCIIFIQVVIRLLLRANDWIIHNKDKGIVVRQDVHVRFTGTWASSCKNVSYAICEQQRRRSACASAQSDQHLCCSLLR